MSTKEHKKGKKKRKREEDGGEKSKINRRKSTTKTGSRITITRTSEAGLRVPTDGMTLSINTKGLRIPRHLPPNVKTRVGNRKVMLNNVDERDWRVRRTKEIYYMIVEDIGGIDYITTLQDLTARHLAWLFTMVEELLEAWINGKDDFDRLEYMAFYKTAIAGARILGLKRVKKIIGAGGTGDNDDDAEPEDFETFLKAQDRKHGRMMREEPGKKRKKSKEISSDVEEIEDEDD